MAKCRYISRLDKDELCPIRGASRRLFMNTSDTKALEGIEKLYAHKLPDELYDYLTGHLDDKIIEDLTWRKHPAEIKAAQMALFRDVLAFDLKNNTDYWPLVFGDRPAVLKDRIEKAFAYIEQLPPLIPVGGLKFYAPTEVDDAKKRLPIISFHQFVDTVYMYKDLDAFTQGSLITSRDYSGLPEIQGWKEVLDGIRSDDKLLYRQPREIHER